MAESKVESKKSDASGAGWRRRDFLKQSAVAAVGVSAVGAPAWAAETTPGITRYRALGRTGLEVSDIGMGTGSLVDGQLLMQALDRGVNYIDTAEGYPLKRAGLGERVIGKTLATSGRREKVVLASKQVARPRDTRKKMMRRLEASLKRLRTDHIDVYFNHAVNDVARMKNPEWQAFVAAAKQQGKIRYSGMSGHGGNLGECLDYVIENKAVDVLLVAYNFGTDPAFYERFTRNFDLVANQEGLPARLSRAKQAGIGVIAMKTLMGAKLNDMRPYEKGGASFAQAAFQWVFANPDVDSLIVSMKSPEMIDEYVAASGSGPLRQGDVQLLQRYLARNGSGQCRPGCGACLDACPAGVPIDDVLRARMYAEDYGEAERGALTYAGLGAGASPCLGCRLRDCAAACDYGLDVPGLARHTARLFS